MRATCLLASIVMVLSAGANCAAEQKVAFLVGVNAYDKPGFSGLKYAERDVEEMAKLLKQFGFHVVLLKGSGTGAARATGANVLRQLRETVRPLGKEDLVLVMLNGHGQQQTGGDAYFCPVDAVSDDRNSLISLTTVVRDILTPHVGRRILLLDACRNDPDPNRGRSAGIQGREVKLPSEMTIFFSCKEGQRSFENNELRHGVFTYFVLEALRKGAVDEDGDVMWSAVEAYVKKQSRKSFSKYLPQGREQTPIDAGGVSATLLYSGVPNIPNAPERPLLKVVGKFPVLPAHDGGSVVPQFGRKTGNLFFASDNLKEVKVFNLLGEEKAPFARERGAQTHVKDLAISPNEEIIGVAGRGGDGVGDLTFLNNKGGGHPVPRDVDKLYLDIEFSPDGKAVALGLSDGRVIALKVGNPPPLWNSKKFNSDVNVLHWSEAGDKLVVGMQSGQVSVWTIEEAGFAKDLEGPLPNPIVFVQQTTLKGQKVIQAASRGATVGRESFYHGDVHVATWNALTGDRQRSPVKIGNTPNSVALAPDGRYAVVGESNGSVSLWDLENPGEAIQSVQVSERQIMYVAISHDGRHACVSDHGAPKNVTLLQLRK